MFNKRKSICRSMKFQKFKIYYVMYRKMHHALLGSDTKFNPSITFFSGMVAGLIGTAASHPFEILRARL